MPSTPGFNPARALLLALSPLLLVGCTSSSQLKELQTQLSEIQSQLQLLQGETASKQDLADLERSLGAEISTLRRSGADVAAEIDRAIGQLVELGVKLDDTGSGLNQLTQEVAAALSQLESLEGVVADLTERGGVFSETLSSDPDELYRRSHAALLQENYQLALVGFQRFVQSYANHEQADDALYWIGECYFSLGRYREAIEEFSRVQQRYPTSDRLPSALLRKGFAYVRDGNSERGRSTLETLINSFPRSDEAIVAQEQLENLDR